MADIVERLRNDVLYVVPSIRLTEEAADEIERLRKANAAMRAWLQQICDIEQSDAVKGVYQLAAVHGTAYRGPHWDMDEVLRFLAQPEPQE